MSMGHGLSKYQSLLTLHPVWDAVSGEGGHSAKGNKRLRPLSGYPEWMKWLATQKDPVYLHSCFLPAGRMIPFHVGKFFFFFAERECLD